MAPAVEQAEDRVQASTAPRLLLMCLFDRQRSEIRCRRLRDVALQRVVITRRAPLEPSRPWFSLARGGGAVAAVRHVPVDLRRARALLAQHRRAVECAHESQTPKSERYRNDQHHVYTRRSLANDCAILVSETVQESRASSNTIRTPFELAHTPQFCLTVGSTQITR